MRFRPALVVCALLLVGSGTVGAEAIAERGVYRVAVDLDQLSGLRATIDVWAFLPAERGGVGEVIALLDASAVDRLRAAGLDPVLDLERTRLHFDRPADPEAARGAGGIPGFSCYRTVDETYADLAAAAAARPALATWSDIGDSWEKENLGGGDDLHVLVVTSASVAGPKPKLVLVAAMHAREYTTAELATRFALHLVDQYGVDPEVTWILDHREIHVVAQMNPDGRRRAETGLFWRKNADNDFCADSNSRGIDLNRNASFLWGACGGGACSAASCSDIFRGPSAGSEPETRAVEDYLAAIFPDRKGDLVDAAPDDTEGVVFSLHSFGRLVLQPWEAMPANSPNHAQLRTLGRKLAFFDGYTVCQDCLGTASGTTVDFAYGELGVAAYTIELGDNFFEPCAAFESTIWPDHLPFLLYAAKAARRPYVAPAGPAALDLTVSASEVEVGETVTVSVIFDDTRHAGPGPDGEAAESAGPVVAGWLSVDVPADDEGAVLMAFGAADGVFDEAVEAASLAFDTSGLATGRHLLYALGEDGDGVRGVPTAIFLDVIESASIFEDGFESGLGPWTAVR